MIYLRKNSNVGIEGFRRGEQKIQQNKTSVKIELQTSAFQSDALLSKLTCQVIIEGYLT